MSIYDSPNMMFQISFILVGCSLINQAFWGTPMTMETPISQYINSFFLNLTQSCRSLQLPHVWQHEDVEGGLGNLVAAVAVAHAHSR